jgi:CheY-like chemotaxis protein
MQVAAVSDRLPKRGKNIMIEHIGTHPEAYHVWLVEDSEADELLMRSALKLDGLDCEFDVSPDGEKAIEFIEALDDGGSRPRPDIVLLDLNLPRKGGARVLERIRQSPKCSRVPVVVVTSSDSPGDKSQVSRLGATRYFQKPLDLMEFLKLGPLVREVLINGKLTDRTAAVQPN